MSMVSGYVTQAFMEPVGGTGRARKLACHVFIMDAQGNPIANGDGYTDDPRIETAVFCALSRPVDKSGGERLAVEVTYEELDGYRMITRFDVKREQSTRPSR
jgi:hypothetical protein